MGRRITQALCCAIFLSSAVVSAQPSSNYQVVAIAAPPFICVDDAPCNPFTPLSASFITNRTELLPGQCLHGGVRSRNGFCVHGLLVDLITYLELNSSAIMPFDLWFTTSAVTGGYNNFVREASQPGYLKSIGRLSACQDGTDNNGNQCVVSPPNSNAGITWDYPCGEKPCDLAIGDISINWFRKRVLGAKFTLPFMDVGLKVITLAIEPSATSKFSNFLDPFTPELWWCWVAFMFFSAFAFAVIEDPTVRGSWFSCCMHGNKQNEALTTTLDKDGDHSVSCLETWNYTYEVVQKFTFLSFLSPFFAVNTDNVETKLGRTYLFGWLVVNFILTASYTASLTSFLVDTNIKVSLPSIQWQAPNGWRSLPQSLAECYDRDDKPCLATSLGGNTEGILNGFLRVDRSHIGSQITDFSLTPSQNYDKILRREVDDIVAWAADETTIDYALLTQDPDVQCDWVQIGDSFATGSFGMVAGPSLPNDVYQRVNQQLEWAKQDKSLDGLKNVWYASARQCFAERTETSALTPEDFGFLFIVVLLIAIIGVVFRVLRQACVIKQWDESCDGAFEHKPAPARDFNDTHVALLRLAEIVKSLNRRIPGYKEEAAEMQLETQERWTADIDSATNRFFFKNNQTGKHVWSRESKFDDTTNAEAITRLNEEWISDTDILTGRMYFWNPDQRKHMWADYTLTEAEEKKLNEHKPRGKRASIASQHRSGGASPLAKGAPAPGSVHARPEMSSTTRTSTAGDIVNAYGATQPPPWGYNQMYGGQMPPMGMQPGRGGF